VNAAGSPLFFVSAVGGIALYIIRATHFGEVFTDWTRALPFAVLLALPGYASLLAMVVPAVPISAGLLRRSVGPRLVAAAGLGTAVVGVGLLLVGLVSSFHSMWRDYMGPFGLDAPEWHPLLPYEVTNAVYTLGPAFLGAWMSITSVQLTGTTVPRAIAVWGVVTGLALVAVMPYLGDYTVYERVLPVVFLAAQAWSLGVGVSLLRTRAVVAAPA
jgi:hypothetical protein